MSDSPARPPGPRPWEGWAALPPIQRVVADPPLVAPTRPLLDAAPGVHGLPPIVEPLGHDVGPTAPVGLVVAPAHGVPRLTSTTALPPPHRSGESRPVRGTPVQRQARDAASSSADPAVAPAWSRVPDPVGPETPDAAAASIATPSAATAPLETGRPVRSLGVVPPGAAARPAALPLTRAAAAPVVARSTATHPSAATSPVAAAPRVPATTAAVAGARTPAAQRAARTGLGAPLPSTPPTAVTPGTTRRGFRAAAPPSTDGVGAAGSSSDVAARTPPVATSTEPDAHAVIPGPQSGGLPVVRAREGRLPVLRVAASPGGATSTQATATGQTGDGGGGGAHRAEDQGIAGPLPARSDTSTVRPLVGARPNPLRLQMLRTDAPGPGSVARRGGPGAPGGVGTQSWASATTTHGPAAVAGDIAGPPASATWTPVAGLGAAATPASGRVAPVASRTAAGSAPSGGASAVGARGTATTALPLARTVGTPYPTAASAGGGSAAAAGPPVIARSIIADPTPIGGVTGSAAPALFAGSPTVGPTATAVVQRVDGSAPPPPADESGGHSDDELDELAGALFGRFRERLRREYIHERESKGLTFDNI